MNLVNDWKWFLRKAWSIRLHLLSGLCSTIALVLPFIGDIIPVHALIALACVASFGGIIAQIVPQPKMERRRMPRD